MTYYIVLSAGFALGYFVCALLALCKEKPLEEKEWSPPPTPKASCMPPGCNDYPECNHRY
jgi:hypothetical protein